ncbi:MAG: response regulator [Nitrospirota bacterium]
MEDAHQYQYKILAVDDDEFSLRLLEKFLAPAGYAVTKAHDGAEALDLLSQERFDLLITDISMPRMSGLRLLEEVEKRHGAIPTIVVTASEINSTTQRKSHSLGARSFMVKPLDRDELLDVVEQVLGKEKA